MREGRSPGGSFMAIVCASPPARLQQARDQALGAEVAERDAGQFMLAVIAARPARQFAATADAGGQRRARQRGKLERRVNTLSHRLRLVPVDALEPRPPGGILLRHSAAPVILL